MTTFVEFHLLQNVGPSALNRDESGNPKKAMLGMVPRARVSSQCWKRAVRRSALLTQVAGVRLATATRTQRMAQLLSPLLARAYPEEEARLVATGFALALAGGLHPRHPERTAVLLTLADEELHSMADLLVEHWPEALEAARAIVPVAEEEAGGNGDEAEAAEPPKKVETPPVFKKIIDRLEAGSGAGSIDMALFGRMLARHPRLEVHAAAQVAHAIGTHALTTEVDYFTAADDLGQPGDGAAMVGERGFASTCLYRYCAVDVDQLRSNLGGDEELARAALAGFARAFILAFPGGAESSMATPTRPSLVLAVVRAMPLTLVNAFVRPVQPPYWGDDDLLKGSVAALDGHWGQTCDVYGTDDILHVAVLTDAEYPLERLAEHRVGSLGELLGRVMDALAESEAVT
jgi:CRISPR system Cascade subunit CasC